MNAIKDVQNKSSNEYKKHKKALISGDTFPMLSSHYPEKTIDTRETDALSKIDSDIIITSIMNNNSTGLDPRHEKSHRHSSSVLGSHKISVYKHNHHISEQISENRETPIPMRERSKNYPLSSHASYRSKNYNQANIITSELLNNMKQ
jgi:hypothetical protein